MYYSDKSKENLRKNTPPLFIFHKILYLYTKNYLYDNN